MDRNSNLSSPKSPAKSNNTKNQDFNLSRKNSTSTTSLH